MPLIDADALRAELIKWRDDDPYRKSRSLIERWVRKVGINVLIRVVEVFPTIEAEPVRHGRWTSFLDGDHIMPERYYKCSRCGRVEYRQEPYCHCGAKMDGGAE